MKSFRPISEVANELQLPAHVLRFWERKFPQLQPLRRGNNRRYYRPSDVALLKGIRELLYNQKYRIEGAQKLIDVKGVAFAREVGEKESK